MRLPKSPGPVAVDTETSGLHPDDGARIASVGLRWRIGQLGLPFDQGLRDKVPNPQLDLQTAVSGDPNLGRAEWRQLLEWLAQQRLVFHNAKFDLTMFRAGTREWEGAGLLGALHWDTQIAASILDPRKPESLDEASKRIGLEGKNHQEPLDRWLRQNRYPAKRYDLCPWDLAEPYVLGDVDLTLRLYVNQKRRLADSPGLKARFRREHELLGVLYKMEERGVAFDAAAALEAAEKLERRAARIEQDLPFKATNQGAKGYYYGTLKLGADRFTENGNPSLDAEQLDKWAAEGVDWAAELAELNKTKRAVSMYYRGYPDKIGPDGRLRCTYKQTRVKSGRMSVERVNLQALPHEDKTLEGVPGVRKLLRSARGHKLWSLDLSQAELRVAAEYARCGPMLKTLAEGIDQHGVTCRDVIGVEDGSRDWKPLRNIAKRLNFAAIFQAGAETFQATLSKNGIFLELEECQRIVRQWRRQYPEFSVAYRRAERMAENKGYVRLLPGTDYEVRSYFGELDWVNTAWSRIVQGSLAEFFKLWQIEVERECPGAMLLTIHDSVLLELPSQLPRRGRAKAEEVAAVGQDLATRLFMRPETGVEMKVDVEPW